MTSFLRRNLAVICGVIVLATAWSLFILKPKNVPPAPLPQSIPTISSLTTAPDWKSLEKYQNTITRSEFEQLITSVFVTGDAWRNFIQLDAASARIRAENQAPNEAFTLNFALLGSEKLVPRVLKIPASLPAFLPNRPLSGLHIAIDPGHIGGDWAKMEERWFMLGADPPVCEGDMTLTVAKILKPRLEALGAKVSLVRDKPQPVTPLRPEALCALALDSRNPTSTESPQQLAERLFYRTAEIHARAQLVNQTLKPDLVLCLHFNAEAWGDATQPILVDRSHFHILINGTYTDEEIAMEDQRHAMLLKLLQRTHQEEVAIGSSIASRFAAITGLPPYRYLPDSKNARQIANQPYLWTRNLLANRLYECPVIFMEPYVMNSLNDYQRIQAGDYEGLKEVGGISRQSIFQEYAEAVTLGLVDYYATQRGQPNPPAKSEP
jgi:N-acetylmuramoyl-L-alanine amidase